MISPAFPQGHPRSLIECTLLLSYPNANTSFFFDIKGEVNKRQFILFFNKFNGREEDGTIELTTLKERDRLI